MKKELSLLLIILIFILTACSKPADSSEINISAAASLKDALLELQTSYEENNDVHLVFNFASSGTLQKQIEQGTPCDLFISAADKQMDMIEEKGIVDKEDRKNLLGNDLVLIVSQDSMDIISDIADITKPEVIRISIGTPQSVPAGSYAKESLQSLELWSSIEPKLIYAKDVRQVLTYVETGEVDAGIVYSSDAKLLKKGKIVKAFPSNSHNLIVYPAAIIKGSKAAGEAKMFLDFLSSAEAAEVFIRYGFKVNKE